MNSEEVILNNFLISLEQDSHIFDGRFTVEEYINLKTALASAIKALGEQRLRGEWIEANSTDLKCSICGHRELKERTLVTCLTYCSLCGAKMGGETE